MTSKQLLIANMVLNELVSQDKFMDKYYLMHFVQKEHSDSGGDVTMAFIQIMKTPFFTYANNGSHLIQATKEGKEAVALGGIENWYQQQEKRESAAFNAQIKSANYTKVSGIAAVVSAAFGIVALGLSMYQCSEAKKSDAEITEIKKQIKQLQGHLPKPPAKTQIKTVLLPDSLKVK